MPATSAPAYQMILKLHDTETIKIQKNLYDRYTGRDVGNCIGRTLSIDPIGLLAVDRSWGDRAWHEQYTDHVYGRSDQAIVAAHDVVDRIRKHRYGVQPPEYAAGRNDSDFWRLMDSPEITHWRIFSADNGEIGVC
jgi:hypothetical protein